MIRNIVILLLVVACAALIARFTAVPAGSLPGEVARPATEGDVGRRSSAAEVVASPGVRYRDVARMPVGAGAIGSAAQGDIVRIGRVELLDGGPLSDTEFLIVDAAAQGVASSGSRGARPDSSDVLLRVRSDGEGELRCAAGEVARLDRPFRLRHLGPPAIPQENRVYLAAAVGSLVHRLPAGRIMIEITDGDERPVDHAAVRIALDSGGSIERFSGPDGSVVLFMSHPCAFDVHCYARERRIGATVEECFTDLLSPAVVRMTLRPMDSGAVRVRVTDPEGRRIERFALRFLDHGRLVRHATEADLWNGELVVGLPEIPVDVRLDERFSGRPVLYRVPRNDTRLVTPDAAATPTLHFEVRLESRIAFDVAGWAEDDPSLLVRIYRQPQAGEGEWQDADVWQFHDNGATVSVSVDGEGRWFTGLLEPGTVRVQVRGGEQSEPLFDQWLELAPGETVVRTLDRGTGGGR